MIISVPTNNQAYITNQNTVTADVNKPETAVNNVDERVNAVVENDKELSSIKIAERLAERSNEPTLQQKEAQNSLASLQSADNLLSDMENVASNLNQAIEQDDKQNSQQVSELRSELKDLTKQLKDVQANKEQMVQSSNSSGDDKEVKVRFNSSEISSLAETLSKIELTEDSKQEFTQNLSGEAGLLNQITKTRNELDVQLKDASSASFSVDSNRAKETSQASKQSMLDETGAKQLNGTSTSADVAVSILS